MGFIVARPWCMYWEEGWGARERVANRGPVGAWLVSVAAGGVVTGIGVGGVCEASRGVLDRGCRLGSVGGGIS